MGICVLAAHLSPHTLACTPLSPRPAPPHPHTRHHTRPHTCGGTPPPPAPRPGTQSGTGPPPGHAWQTGQSPWPPRASALSSVGMAGERGRGGRAESETTPPPVGPSVPAGSRIQVQCSSKPQAGQPPALPHSLPLPTATAAPAAPASAHHIQRRVLSAGEHAVGAAVPAGAVLLRRHRGRAGRRARGGEGGAAGQGGQQAGQRQALRAAAAQHSCPDSGAGFPPATASS